MHERSYTPPFNLNGYESTGPKNLVLVERLLVFIHDILMVPELSHCWDKQNSPYL